MQHQHQRGRQAQGGGAGQRPAGVGVRTLAEILARFLHMASAADKTALSKLAT
jgi:hypothetical protein